MNCSTLMSPVDGGKVLATINVVVHKAVNVRGTTNCSQVSTARKIRVANSRKHCCHAPTKWKHLTVWRVRAWKTVLNASAKLVNQCSVITEYKTVYECVGFNVQVYHYLCSKSCPPCIVTDQSLRASHSRLRRPTHCVPLCPCKSTWDVIKPESFMLFVMSHMQNIYRRQKLQQHLSIKKNFSVCGLPIKIVLSVFIYFISESEL